MPWKLLSLILVLAYLCGAAQAETVIGRVVGVTDGDTLTLLDGNQQQHKIRLSGIDAPEKAQPLGERSKLNLSDLAFGQDATADCSKRDRYRREVCSVFVNGEDIGLQQVTAGMAHWYREYAKEQTQLDRIRYGWAELWAKTRRRGLWAEENPVPPWVWRRAAREKMIQD